MPGVHSPQTAVEEIGAGRLYLQPGKLPYREQRTQGFKPRADLPAWPLSIPVDWRANPYNDKMWCLRLNMWRMVDPIMVEWFRSRDPDLLTEMFSYAEDWWKAHQRGLRSKYAWIDMAGGIRAIRLAFLVNQYLSGPLRLSEDQRTALFEMVDLHAEFLLNPRNFGLTNHGVFQAVGLRLLSSQCPERPSLNAAWHQSAEFMHKLLSSIFTDEGIQKEHSPGYHLFVANLLNDLEIADLFADVPGLQQLTRRTLEVSPWLAFPDGTVSRIGDSGGSAPPLSAAPASHATESGHLLADWSRSGWIIVRSRPTDPIERQSMLFFASMFFNYSHKHADELGFELFERGRRILVDRGRYAYLKGDPMRVYVESASAHNTVDLLDTCIDPRSTAPYGSGLRPAQVGNGEFVLSGRVEGRAGCFDHERTLRYRPGVSLIIDDRVVADRPRRFVSWLHISHELEISGGNGEYTIATPDGVSLAHVKPSGSSETICVSGAEEPLQGWESPTYRRVRPATTLGAVASGREVAFSWCVMLA